MNIFKDSTPGPGPIEKISRVISSKLKFKYLIGFFSQSKCLNFSAE